MPTQSTFGAAAVHAFRPGSTRSRLFGTGTYSAYTRNDDGWAIGGNAAGAGFYWPDRSLTNGKWYWEFVIGVDEIGYIGVTDSPTTLVTDGGNPSANAGMYPAGNDGWGEAAWGGVVHTGSASFAAGDTVGIALNMDSTPKKLQFYKNGVIDRYVTWANNITPLYPMFCFYGPAQILFGPGLTYAPPVGFSAYR